jgi:hypothetical protein
MNPPLLRMMGFVDAMALVKAEATAKPVVTETTVPASKDSEPTWPLKFYKNQLVLHVKSKGCYRICGLPDEYAIEATGERAYAYQQMPGADNPHNSRVKWVRRQTEMEDGRFVDYIDNSYPPSKPT